MKTNELPDFPDEFLKIQELTHKIVEFIKPADAKSAQMIGPSGHRFIGSLARLVSGNQVDNVAPPLRTAHAGLKPGATAAVLSGQFLNAYPTHGFVLK